MTAPKLEIMEIAPTALVANPWNTNVVPPDSEKKIAKSLERFGFFKPILARTNAAGALEILGGEHRWRAALDAGYDKVPVINLGTISDERAKEISLVDNGRYGADDTVKLAELLESLGDISDLSQFMPYDSVDIEQIFSASNINFDDLEIDDEGDGQEKPKPSKKVQEFQIMRFKIPVADAARVQEVVETVMKKHGFTGDDSLTNAGMALVQLCSEVKA